MKVLYKPIVDYHKLLQDRDKSMCGDYVADTLFHGFRKLLGPDLIDIPKNPQMYKSDYERVKGIFPRHGFSLFNRVEDEKIDREDIEKKMKLNYFKYVICPLHHTNRDNQQVINENIDYLSRYFDPGQIAIICGDEGPDTNIHFLKDNKKCTLFKIELLDKYKDYPIHPISYSIPAEIIVDSVPEKIQDFAPLIPSIHGDRHKETYIYTDEEEYFNSYRNSYYGFTCKKGGWDCLRHYEILACGCVPFFTDLEFCPKQTLHNYPKDLVIQAKKLDGLYPKLMHELAYRPEHSCIGTCRDSLETYGHQIDHDTFPKDEYLDIANQLLEYTKLRLTTEANASYILSNLKR